MRQELGSLRIWWEMQAHVREALPEEALQGGAKPKENTTCTCEAEL